MHDIPDMITIPSGIMPTVPNVGFREDFSGLWVGSFEIGKFAVTLSAWEELMDYTPPEASNLSLGKPVISVNWFEVHRYIDALNIVTGNRYRLPTELEWEYAARAGTSGSYHYPRKIALKGDVINYDKKNNGVLTTGSFPPNEWGCHEMLGNVWEWVSDGGRTVPGFNGLHDEYELKVLKGGCWASGEFDIQLSSRVEHRKNVNGWGTFGFRLAKEISPENL
ncbi:hypothetical protein A9Q99_00560 [Gammaproteobacteria bacterium 45_16_T64]|nr:hypothetical protein A9Q99_00560 [Gammaproteobacteria bacterium 45_16_T64]